jgi:transposase
MAFASAKVLCTGWICPEHGRMGEAVGRSYLTDVSDEEWEFVLPYLLLSRVDNRSREHDLRALFSAVRYIVKTGNQWRLMPHDLPPWPVAYQQSNAGCGRGASSGWWETCNRCCGTSAAARASRRRW